MPNKPVLASHKGGFQPPVTSHCQAISDYVNVFLCLLEQLECLRSENTPRHPMIIHTIEIHIGSQVKTRHSQSYKFEKFAKIQILKFCNKLYTWHTFWSCLIICINMKWIQQVLLKIQSGQDSIHRQTDGQTTWNQYTPFQLCWIGGYDKFSMTRNNMFPYRQQFCWLAVPSEVLVTAPPRPLLDNTADGCVCLQWSAREGSPSTTAGGHVTECPAAIGWAWAWPGCFWHHRLCQIQILIQRPVIDEKWKVWSKNIAISSADIMWPTNKFISLYWKIQQFFFKHIINTLRSIKMASISQPTLSNAFSWVKLLEFLLKFHIILFLRVKLTIFQHWFR